MSNKSYTELLDKDYKNKENIFILGAGPSLYKNTLDSFFPRLRKYGIIICVNSSIMAIDPDIFITNDHLVTFWDYWEKVLNSKCIKIVRNSWLKYKDEIKGFYIFEPRKTKEDIVDFNEKGKLCYCSSVISALDFSIQCNNISKIFLLGVDQCLDERTGYHHFWEYLPKKQQPRSLKRIQANWESQKKVFKYNNMSYKALKEFAGYKNVEIYNCNENSSVEVFKKIKFEEIENYL